MLLPAFLLSTLSTRVTTTLEVSRAFRRALELTGMKVDRAAWLMGISRPQLIGQLTEGGSSHLSLQRVWHMRREDDGLEFVDVFFESLRANDTEDIDQLVSQIQSVAASLATRIRMAKATLTTGIKERRTA